MAGGRGKKHNDGIRRIDTVANCKKTLPKNKAGSPLVAQWNKDPALSLLWLRSLLGTQV